MKTNIIILAIASLALALVVYLTYKKERHAVPTSVSVSVPGNPERKQVNQPGDQPPPVTPQSHKRPTTASGAKTSKAPTRLSSDELRKKSLESKARRKQARKADLGKDYSILFKRLALSEVDLDTLKNLIVELEFASSNAWTSLGASNDIAEARRLTEENKQITKEQIREFIGDEQFAFFDHYYETLNERRGCEVITSRFAYEAEPLTSDTREQLIDIMYESQKAYEASDISKIVNTSPHVNNIERFNFLKNKTLELSQSILTASQLKSIENYYNDTIQAIRDEQKTINDWYNEKMKREGKNNPAPQQ